MFSLQSFKGSIRISYLYIALSRFQFSHTISVVFAFIFTAVSLIFFTNRIPSIRRFSSLLYDSDLADKRSDMVIALGPGRFYGKSLPRPRIYEDVKFNDHRVDPPVPVSDPLMSWAEEAHWSMGGLSFTRHRLQGKIEGNMNKIRAEEEKQDVKIHKKSSSPVFNTPSPPPTPIAIKRKRRVVDEAEDVSFPVRKLGDEFDRVAQEGDSKRTVAQTRGRKAEKVVVEAEVAAKEKPKGLKRLKKGIKVAEKTVPASPSRKRSSPRLSKPELP